MIQDILPRYQEMADGIKTEFTPPFDILDSSYIIVYINDVRLTTGYSVVSNKIVFTTAPVNNSLVTIQRVLPIEWTNENYGSIDKEVFSNILTNLVAQMQTLKEAVDRAVKTEPYDRDDGGAMAEDFLRQMREALDILDELERLMPSLVALKSDIDTYIEDASESIIAYINNMTSDNIAEFSQLADQKLTQLQAIISTISTDTNLGGNNASNSVTSSQKAIKTYVDTKEAALQGQIDVKAADNAVVHLAGTETITGGKTFSSNVSLSASAQGFRHIYSNNSAVTKGTTPGTIVGTDYLLRDSANSNIGGVGCWYNVNGNIRAGLHVYTPTAGSTANATLSVSNYASGRADILFEVPNGIADSCTAGVTNSTSSNMIPTKGWVNNPATSTNVVHRTGNETIAGTKTFSSTISGSINGNAATVTNGVYTTGNQTIAGNKTFSGTTKFTADPSVTRDFAGFNLNASNITKGTAPSADVLYSRYRLRDKDGTIMSSVYGIYRSNRSNQLGFEVMKANANSDTAYSRLALIVAADGTAYGICPTPEVSASGTTIATAGYINNKFKKVSTLPASPDANTFYFIPE